jgi:NhaA family Na+:H+ antiporter
MFALTHASSPPGRREYPAIFKCRPSWKQLSHQSPQFAVLSFPDGSSMHISNSFKAFLESDKSGGILLLACTIVSMSLANSGLGSGYLAFWHLPLAGLTVEHWVNDGLMAVFFLLIGLELERELYNGELSSLRQALLPILAAAGGVAVPAALHFSLNGGSPTAAGVGIPMATDIAFALGVMALLGKRVPLALKVFLTALAVMDDLMAIVVIALFYTSSISAAWLGGALATFALLLILNLKFRVMALAPYVIGGAVMWILMLKSGVHATIAGVLLAFAIPFSSKVDDAESPSHRLEHALHWPVRFLILPTFALANTGVVLGAGWTESLLTPNSLGIMLGLFLGKTLGITGATYLAVRCGVGQLPNGLTWRHVAGAAMLGGIGFTMSIFITNLAFAGNADAINSSKIAILVGSLISGIAGFLWLRSLAIENGESPPSAQTRY